MKSPQKPEVKKLTLKERLKNLEQSEVQATAQMFMVKGAINFCKALIAEEQQEETKVKS